ncbi:aKG-HExxH-type peptide beta-hydroxylase [Cystobacter ferrugineus]|uniref:HEXXH motif domain-containing protein n=1 Tax=Cystobacter ferrugineus TaxID=83449 RepID=A0A1L9B103_9BACT|nr:HEXXH motif-containing putative peptide modification protein [Cystobacter ferrugineus]OJH35935.1 hypothetical protein BON30_35575 [Cystobacter ferrugineus]
MHIQPELDEAWSDQAAVTHLLIDTLREELGFLGAGTPALLATLDVTNIATYPGLWALAYRYQQPPRGEDARARCLEDVRHLLDEARLSAERAEGSVAELWPVDLAPPARHLVESLERAVRQAPRRPGYEAALAEMTLTPWREEQRQVFLSTCRLLAALWPEALAELRIGVRQVVLMEGGGLEGFTDFAVHGAIFVNAHRLAPGRIPAPIRLAEALLHEGCHTRCNAAAVVRPFLKPSGKDAPYVMTPLRPDPRPLTGLFQQLVVLARCLTFYERLVGWRLGGASTAARCERLRARAHQALATLEAHAGALTEHGLAVVAEAGRLMAPGMSSQDASV